MSPKTVFPRNSVRGRSNFTDYVPGIRMGSLRRRATRISFDSEKRGEVKS